MKSSSETIQENPSGSAAASAAGTPAGANAKLSPAEKLIEFLTPFLEKLGYELVHLELQNHRPFTLRLYIDVLGARGEAIGVEDCAIVSRALDEPLENLPELDVYFGGAYELEVSSPGVDRPLRKARDFEKFAGRDARIHTLRALTADELGNADYQQRNPKQKNFLGVLNGVLTASDGAPLAVKLTISASMGKRSAGESKSKHTKAASKTASKTPEKKDDILVPFALISKANIEPDFDFKTND